ncbi:hypothetical protein REPUB_Repub05bG0129600 [Reevesia pubescens]
MSTRMFVKSSFLVNGSCLRYLSSSNVLKIGDVLRHRRVFSNEDVVEYSKVSHDANPLHFDSESARAAGFGDRLVHGMLVASLFPRIIASHFVSRFDLLSTLLIFPKVSVWLMVRSVYLLN